MTTEILSFLRKKLENTEYSDSLFRKLAINIADAEAPASDRTTKPGNFNRTVSIKSKREVAFQRALYGSEGQILIDGQWKKVCWCDIELPVTFSNNPRRPSVDIIGHLEKCGHFLCELKYAKSGMPPKDFYPDHAVLEALFYYGVVEKNKIQLDERGVVHKNHNQANKFRWIDVAKSKMIMVLANETFWGNACAKRIHELVSSIDKMFNIKVLLYKTPDFDPSQNANEINGRYTPQMPDFAVKWTPVFVTAPTEMI